MASPCLWLLVGLLILNIEGIASQNDTCNGTCTIWERCIEDDDSTMANIGNTFPVCVLTNECPGGCDANETCCGHDHCECIWPKIIDSSGNCRDCDCRWDEECTINGTCVCNDHQVRDGEECVDCNPYLTCPNCTALGRVCALAPGNPEGTCECPSGQVENANGECVPCIPCPEECPHGQVCLTNLTSMEAYCGCPPDTRPDGNGNCIPCPACPECHGDHVCVIRGAEARCECPYNTVEVWNECKPIEVCPDCGHYEVCAIPDDEEAPYCKCKEGYIRKYNGDCAPCSAPEAECHSDYDCHHGKVCTYGQCECPKDYTPKYGKCIRPGLAGGLCDHGECYGKHVICGARGYCECSPFCFKDPRPVCVLKKKRW